MRRCDRVRVAVFSGGKDSIYAASLCWPIDCFVTFVYEFPSPSPHLENLGAAVKTGLSIGVPVFVLKLRKGNEQRGSADFFSKIGAKEIIAGDVYVEDHLKYMEELAEMCGAKLKEPLWGEDPEEVLRREMEYGIESFIIGTISEADDLLCCRLNLKTYEQIAEKLKKRGLDPLGERGEYHTLVVNSPLHSSRLKVEVLKIETYYRSKIAIIRASSERK